MYSLQHLLWNQELEIYNSWEQRWPSTWSFQDNKNHHIRLWLIQSGEVEGWVEGKRYIARQGDICLWPSAGAIQFRSVGGGELRYLTVLFTMHSTMGLDFCSYMDIPVFLRNMDSEWVEAQMRSIIREFRNTWVGYEMMAKAKLQEILVNAIRAGNCSIRDLSLQSGDSADKQFRLLPIVRHFIEFPSSYPTSGEMAAMLQVSEAHLRRLFKQTFSVTPNHFMHQFKINQSKRLLRETSLSTSEIAYQVGFESPNYFSKVFRHHAGCSPREFRFLTGKTYEEMIAGRNQDESKHRRTEEDDSRSRQGG